MLVSTRSALILVILVMAGVRTDAESPIRLTVRLYNAIGISNAELATARAVAGPILEDAGIDVVFRRCAESDASGSVIDACDDSLKPAEVVARVIPAPHFNPELHPEAYGVTYVVEQTNSGWLATLFADRIAAAATRAAIEPGVLLGRVLAHELGHLLIGRGYHGDTGVMRAEWPRELLQRRADTDWRFSNVEASVMQRALTAVAR